MLAPPACDNGPDLLAVLASPSPSEAAAALASLGFPVFPVHWVDRDGRCSCGRANCPDAGKHPRTPNGLLNATTDQRQIEEWWRRWWNANVAVATGTTAGVWVLDVDPDNGGLASIEHLEALHGELVPTWCVETGGGGLHLWFRHPCGRLRNSVGRLGPGLDVRADGGYVIAPPSRHRSGNNYRWASSWHPTRVDLALAPQWLIDLARRPSDPKMIPPDGSHIDRKVGGNQLQPLPDVISEGARNATLTSLAGSMRRKGFGEAAILSALQVENAERCDPPLPDSEISRIAQSISRYAPAPDARISRRSSRSGSFVEFVDGKAVAR